jgi:glycosyltransferase involved in cell wall biosynthesis
MTSTSPPGPIQRIAFIGTHLPRHCGIATFTADLSRAVAAASPAAECLVVAVSDPGKVYTYPDSVRFQIEEGELAAYRRAAQFINVNSADVVCLQHEYGIFGGKAGSHVLTLLSELRMPVVTTLHTILTAPSPEQKRIMDEVIARSERLVVMSAHGAETLAEVHGVTPDVVDIVPHGIPLATPGSRGKQRLGLEGRHVVLTFGLLSPDKGIEYVIDALPAILARHPSTVFVVVGATHPHVKERHGEAYRLSLAARARRLGVEASVVFHDRFVSDDELAEFLGAADIYVTPYLNLEQSTSGTLTRAVAAGRAVISTPYFHARELLGGECGVLVPVRDAAAIASAVDGLLGDEARRVRLGNAAAARGLRMAWPVVADLYLKSFSTARLGERRARSTWSSSPTPELPELNLDHLRALTDDTGILQHARFAVPRYAEGYCLDDNARALMLMALADDSERLEPRLSRMLAARYLAFVAHAFDGSRLRFRNFMSFSRQFSEDFGSDDSHGHAVWALGTAVGRASQPWRTSLAGELFQAALPALVGFRSPRAWAYGLLGIDEYLHAFAGDNGVEAVRRELVDRLVELYRKSSTPDWPWFESSLTYSNPRLSQALLVSGSAMGSSEVAQIGLDSLTWLAELQTSAAHCFAPIGSNGFYVRGGTKADFDQQPVEAAAMVSASLAALRVSRKPIWAEHACRAFDWFLGRNHLDEAVYDSTTGGCRDGLHADRANENQGAESTLSFLLALVEMRSSDYARLPRLKLSKT